MVFKKGYKHTEEWKKQASARMLENKYTLGKKQSVETIKLRADKAFGKIRTTGSYRRIKTNCANCGKEIIRQAYRMKNHNYCNASCQMQYEYAHGRPRNPSEAIHKAASELRGEKRYNWKGGKKEWKLKIYDFYYNTSWAQLRAKIYERDKWTCQICGVHCDKKQNRIQCHHIVPYRINQDNSEGNLITLCVSCHRREEAKYYWKLRKAD